jgi:DNA invertase Pin-like site-specific DNA recombinase
MFGMIGVMAEFEKSLSVERVRAGMRNAKLKGVAVGRPTKQLDMKAVNARRAKGERLRAIAADMGCAPRCCASE